MRQEDELDVCLQKPKVYTKYLFFISRDLEAFTLGLGRVDLLNTTNEIVTTCSTSVMFCCLIFFFGGDGLIFRATMHVTPIIVAVTMHAPG